MQFVPYQNIPYHQVSQTEGPRLTRFFGLGKNRVSDFRVSGGLPVTDATVKITIT